MQTNEPIQAAEFQAVQTPAGDFVKEGLARAAEGHSLSREQARLAMEGIMGGAATPAQIGGFLLALRMKGETTEEITGFAEAMRGFAGRVGTRREDLLDTCGTGGSGIHKFNISTASALIAASASVRVAKHGNRSASGRAGSADVLEALGVNIGLNGAQAADCLDRIGICFLFAQTYHPSMKHAAAPRRELGVRTVFNLLGPLTNPAGADRQLLGLYDAGRTEQIASVLGNLGTRRALVVAGLDGLDEISVSGPTRVSELKDGVVRTYEITPEELGLSRHALEDILGGDAADNARIVREVLSGKRGARRDIVLANAGACIYTAGRAGSLVDGVRMAADIVDSGLASDKLEQLIRITGECSYVS
ncbi:anthranilate phosphoribosyltransferase [Saccharibacillus sp. CPCC 101409]|uniref:anthranilate phosphoribosyltransferase n=1 Tax=Saccharibacillus sp. CPCC 101409 TaxID=3058041 RepID=UPI002671E6D7|nr:anthranilate phosphoribosyltransferase [Saccharibacillus sp. CPCC 101409]MDO3409612.1 anthranilate phosphoribosyltransferase [Saccharibacillus sp. CPCC 101409]